MDSLINAFDLKVNSVRLTIIGLVTGLVLLSWFGFLDTLSKNYIDSAIVQSTVAFGLARGLNAVISMLQSTEVSFSLGVGMSVGIGEMLDPINDLVEQYSSLMKMALGSLIIQKLLIEIVSDIFFKVLITLSGIALIASFFYQQSKYVNVFVKTFIFLLFIRFLLVLVVLLNSWVDSAFIQEKISGDISTLESLTQEVETNVGSSHLTESQKIALKQEMALLDAQVGKREGEKLILTKVLADQQNKLSGLIDLADKYRQSQGLNRFNPLNEDERLDNTKLDIAELEQSMELVQLEIDELDDQIETLNERLVFADNTLQKKPNSFSESMSQKFSALGDKVSNMTSKVDIIEIKERLEASVINIVNVMTIFLFKTLILPLAFLYLLIKGTNKIWGINVQELVEKNWGQS